ncbi:transmembrane protein [Spiroplasma clarkii]|uniref:hypothetical protein n=1 Tax=Spiroplasma clarkii TaxID=2139 RepID=UPI000B57203C|nr:hypothetical protein [Spiroplasma clarkii]ARU91299.1 transmembrane protein [Spiroplasma clarkii]
MDLTDFLQETLGNDFQKQNSDFFDDYVFLNETTSTIQKVGDTGEPLNLPKSELVSAYRNILNPSPLNLSNLTFNPDPEATKLVTEKLFDPVMLIARVLEQYLIERTSIFVFATQNRVNIDSESWKEYIGNRNLFNIYNMLNMHNAFVTNYTYYTGISGNDLWFDPYSVSFINLAPEKIFS